MNNQDLIDMIYIATLSSIISNQTIQKIKQTINFSTIFNKIISIFISFSIGFCFSISFYNYSILYSLWIGLFTLIGAESLYKTFKGYFGLYSLKDMNNINNK